MCSNCDTNYGRWRCRDCMFPTMQCRKCLRNQHLHEPFHRIECWTGNFFRPAAIWEVGGYVMIRHHGEIGLCDTLKFQKTLLNDIQVQQDIVDQEQCQNETTAVPSAVPLPSAVPSAVDEQFSNNNRTDNIILAEMDRLHSKDDENSNIEVQEMMMEDDNEAGEKDCDDEAFTGFKDYLGSMPESKNLEGTAESSRHKIGTREDILVNIQTINDTFEPKKDAFNNHYVRIAHTNGIHHLAVITCTCRGTDNLPIDLMYSRLVPTSFTIIRTLFTTMALDTFRLANLEMKASAYQYFQFIQRLTSKTTNNVPNLYSDLRKLSRAWRWMKKMKWAGFGHNATGSTVAEQHPTMAAVGLQTAAGELTTTAAVEPAAGQLTIFCPACPQPNINLPSDWKTDKNRYNVIFMVYHCSNIQYL